MKKEKLLGILPSFSSGGAEKVTLEYFNNFEKRPLILKLLVINKKGPLSVNKKNIIKFNYTRFLFSIPRLILLINKKKLIYYFQHFPIFH